MNEIPKEFDDNDPVIDALLGEYLGGKLPRALDADTLGGIIANSTFLEDEEIRRMDFACAKAELELEVAAQRASIPLGPKVVLASTHDVAPPRSLYSRLALGSLAMLAACLLILASSFLAVNRQPNQAKSSPDKALDNQIAKNDEQSIATDVSQGRDKVVATTDDVELPKQLPFAPDREIPLEPATPLSPKVAAKWSANQEQVLATINSQFEQLWQHADLVKTPAVDLEQWAQRVTLALKGKPASGSALLQLAKEQDGPELRKQYVDTLLQSEEFTRYWADRLLDRYFSIPSNGRRDISKSREIVSSAIRNNDSIANLWTALLSPENAGEGSLWLTAHKGQDAKASAGQLLSLGNGNKASCVRCHQEGGVQSNEIADVQSSDQFWKLAALLHKVQVQDDAKIDWHMDRELFYDHQNEGVQLATAGFANIDTAKGKQVSSIDDAASALKSWGQWLSSSQKSREHFVDVVWNELFHMPLGQNDVYESSEFAELADLRGFLAQQRAGADDSLKVLISSIVLSDVFSVPTIEISESWYLVASDANIEQLRRQMRLFSNHSVPPESTISNHNQLITWLKTFNQPAKVLLAQPKQIDLENAKPITSSAKEKASLSASQLEWLVRSKHYSPDTSKWIDSLSDSQMNWEMVTNHIYFAELGRDATREELQDGKAMLDISSSKKVAIARILASLSMQ